MIFSPFILKTLMCDKRDTKDLKHIGLKPARKWPMLNGSLECMFQEYELFAGDRKQHVIRKKQSE